MASERKCAFAECDSKHFAKSFCKKHYSRLLRYGDANYTQRAVNTTLKERIALHSKQVGDCIEWQGALKNTGYGQMGIDGKTQIVTRVVFELENGFIDDDKFVCHTCDNRKCIKPSHLFQGTQKDNMVDAKNKGRLQRGSDRHNSKFSNDDVLAIRKRIKLGDRMVDIARSYNVYPQTIINIKTRNTWDWLL